MLLFIVKRFLLMIPTLAVISVISYIIIELPPGDYVTTYINQLTETGDVPDHVIENLRHQYGLNQPWYVRYLKWITRFLRGDMGYSLAWHQPVRDLIGARLLMSFLISFAALMFTWVVAFPIGIYSAVKQYSLGDYFFTFTGFMGLAIPNFLLALILMYLAYKYLDTGVGGLYSREYDGAPWSFGKIIDLLKHLAIPIVIIGTAGTAGTIRVMRANLLDELQKPYVITARAKGLQYWKLILRYPVRLALNPFISTVGWVLPSLIAGETIVSVVLSLPTAGPLFLQALLEEDMYLAGSFVLLAASLTVIGTLLSDILLAVIDPRIRYEGTN